MRAWQILTKRAIRHGVALLASFRTIAATGPKSGRRIVPIMPRLPVAHADRSLWQGRPFSAAVQDGESAGRLTLDKRSGQGRRRSVDRDSNGRLREAFTDPAVVVAAVEVGDVPVVAPALGAA